MKNASGVIILAAAHTLVAAFVYAESAHIDACLQRDKLYARVAWSAIWPVGVVLVGAVTLTTGNTMMYGECLLRERH